MPAPKGGKPPFAKVARPASRVRKPPPRLTTREDERLPMDERDLTEPDQLETWMAEQLRDWQLAIGAHTFGQLVTILEGELEAVKAKREATRNDLRAEGYLEGQINVYETTLAQLRRAVSARMDRIGEVVRE